MIRVVTFDAAGTLIRLLRPPGVIYAETARLFGYRLDPDRVQEAFRTTLEGTSLRPQNPQGPVRMTTEIGGGSWLSRTMEVSGLSDSSVRRLLCDRVPDLRSSGCLGTFSGCSAHPDRAHALENTPRSHLELRSSALRHSCAVGHS